MDRIAQLTLRMAEFNAGRPDLTQHLLKVYGFARTIALLEGMAPDALHTLEIAALMHDIGIKYCLDTYGKCTGKMQEEEGPPLARAILREYSVDEATTERVCYLIGHHHTYTDIDGLDYQILVEADFLVNLFEGGADDAAKAAALRSIFRTGAGKRLFFAMFGQAGEDGI